MTYQNILIFQSSDSTRDSFISHFKQAFSLVDLSEEDFELDNLHNLLNNQEKDTPKRN